MGSSISKQAVLVSVFVLTLNEAVNLRRCIEVLDWCDDVVVLDSLSSDETAEIVKELGARVFERSFDNFASQRNHALDSIDFKHDSISHLDADEVVTEELVEDITTAIARKEFTDYKIASKLMFMGKWLKQSGMYPVYRVRLGRGNGLRFQQVGHVGRCDG